jgi:hypothetical protein
MFDNIKRLVLVVGEFDAGKTQKDMVYDVVKKIGMTQVMTRPGR